MQEKANVGGKNGPWSGSVGEENGLTCRIYIPLWDIDLVLSQFFFETHLVRPLIFSDPTFFSANKKKQLK